MKILILSCNTGSGHNSAAAAIKEYFDSREIYCEILDALAFDSKLKSQIVSKGHLLLYKKATGLFGASYQFAENHPPKHGKESVLYTIMKKGADKLYEYLSENRFDAVLCTHIFAGMMMTEIKKCYPISARVYFTATDYASYPGIEEVEADAFFIAHESMRLDYIRYGIEEHKLIPAGIPIKRAFHKSLPKEKAKDFLGLPQNKKVILLMCGNMDSNPVLKLGKTLLKKLPDDAKLVVVCGSNEKLVDKFEKLSSEENLRAVGFTNKMNVYMDACDVVITKPGGLSSTEAAVKNIPMILLNTAMGCETRNLDFFLNGHFAVSANTPDGLANETIALLTDEERLEEMRALLRGSFFLHSADTIGEYVISDVENNREEASEEAFSLHD
jgi:processive 1,2-diacylglycerol beta-glucosyltransferase